MENTSYVNSITLPDNATSTDQDEVTLDPVTDRSTSMNNLVNQSSISSSTVNHTMKTLQYTGEIDHLENNTYSENDFTTAMPSSSFTISDVNITQDSDGYDNSSNNTIELYNSSITNYEKTKIFIETSNYQETTTELVDVGYHNSSNTPSILNTGNNSLISTSELYNSSISNYLKTEEFIETFSSRETTSEPVDGIFKRSSDKISNESTNNRSNLPTNSISSNDDVNTSMELRKVTQPSVIDNNNTQDVSKMQNMYSKNNKNMQTFTESNETRPITEISTDSQNIFNITDHQSTNSSNSISKINDMINKIENTASFELNLTTKIEINTSNPSIINNMTVKNIYNSTNRIVADTVMYTESIGLSQESSTKINDEIFPENITESVNFTSSKQISVSKNVTTLYNLTSLIDSTTTPIVSQVNTSLPENTKETSSNKTNSETSYYYSISHNNDLQVEEPLNISNLKSNLKVDTLIERVTIAEHSGSSISDSSGSGENESSGSNTEIPTTPYFMKEVRYITTSSEINTDSSILSTRTVIFT